MVLNGDFWVFVMIFVPSILIVFVSFIGTFLDIILQDMKVDKTTEQRLENIIAIMFGTIIIWLIIDIVWLICCLL